MFYDAKLPGLSISDGQLTDVIKIMAFDSPDSLIQAKIKLFKTSDPCSNPDDETSSNSETDSMGDFQECNEGFVTDPNSNFCYKILSINYDEFYKLNKPCYEPHSENDLLYFDSDLDVQIFIDLALQGKYHLLD